MNKTYGFVAAWLAGTFVAVLIGAAAVGNVRNEVTDGPTTLGAPNTTVTIDEPDPEPVTLTTAPDEIVTPIQDQGDVVESPTTTTTIPQDTTESTTTTSEPHDHEVSTSSTTPPTTATTSTTAPPTATTTTIASYTKTYDVEDAGTVRITVAGENVTFAGAVPSEGWTAKPKDKGPDEVEVQFEKNDDDGDAITFKAEMKDGQLEVSIKEKD